MGTIYHRQDSRFWWVGYVGVDGRAYQESTRSTKKGTAQRLLRLREGAIERGEPITPRVGRLRFDAAAADVVTDYRVNGQRSGAEVARRIRMHLLPYFGRRKMTSISTTDIRAYTAMRLDAGAKPATINRELSILRRSYTLAVQAGTLLTRPYVPMLQEDNARRGFFEPDQYASVLAHLPEAIRPVVAFAYLTGWRVASEILPLQWRQVDLTAGEIRLDPGTTKNREGRVYPLTAALRALLEEQRAVADGLKKAGTITPWVFHRDGKRIRDFRYVWDKARTAAGCPGQILHNFRRTAVRNLDRASVPRSTAMAMVGHKTESIYRRYAIVDKGALKDAADRLDEAASTAAEQARKQAAR